MKLSAEVFHCRHYGRFFACKERKNGQSNYFFSPFGVSLGFLLILSHHLTGNVTKSRSFIERKHFTSHQRYKNSQKQRNQFWLFDLLDLKHFLATPLPFLKFAYLCINHPGLFLHEHLNSSLDNGRLLSFSNLWKIGWRKSVQFLPLTLSNIFKEQISHLEHLACLR